MKHLAVVGVVKKARKKVRNVRSSCKSKMACQDCLVKMDPMMSQKYVRKVVFQRVRGRQMNRQTRK